ncbi:MAG: hypothetical protein QM756_47295 [Polyangiaceae bacterium]
MLGLWPAVSVLFHRADVRESTLQGFVKVSRDESLRAEATLPAPPQIGLVARTGVDFAPNAQSAPVAQIVERSHEGRRRQLQHGRATPRRGRGSLSNGYAALAGLRRLSPGAAAAARQRAHRARRARSRWWW